MDKSQEIAEALSELDHVVQESWGLKLVRNLDWHTNPFHVIAASVEDGFDLNIGGNSFQFLSQEYIDSLQYMFEDIPGFIEKAGFTIASAQDVHPIYVSKNELSVWGALAGATSSWYFGESIPQFINAVRDCFLKCQGIESAQENKELALTVLKQYPKIDKDGWLEYFYG